MNARYKLPKKSRLRDIADSIWSKAVKNDWANKCAVCNRKDSLESHHLIRKSSVNSHRYTLRNGICLCSTHHMFDHKCSPHAGDIGFSAWLVQHHPAIITWCEEHKSDKTTESVNQHWYIEKMLELREYVEPEYWTKICGVRLATHLESMK